jgi:DUF1680 family protein
VNAQADGEAVINLFVAGTARFHLNGTTVVLTQRGAHPRDEEVVVEVDQGYARLTRRWRPGARSSE